MQSDFQRLWSEPSYRDWFGNWWEQDFSIAGLERRGIEWRFAHAPVERIPFEGREWARGWLPPHDATGTLNQEFFDRPRPDWHHIVTHSARTGLAKARLEGAWISALSLSNLMQPFEIAADGAFLEGLSLDTARQLTLRLRRAYSFGGIIIRNSSLAAPADLRGMILKAQLELQQVGGAAVLLNVSRVHGPVRASGISRLSFRGSIVESDVSIDTSVAVIDGYRAKMQRSLVIQNVNSHSPATVNLRRAHIHGSLSLTEGASASDFDLSHAVVFGDVTFSRNTINNLDFTNCILHANVKFRELASKLVRLDSCTIGGDITFSGGTFTWLNVDDAHFHGVVKASDAIFKITISNGATFLGPVDLSRNAFGSETRFLNCTFESACTFAGAGFAGPVACDGTKFNAGADFAGEAGGIDNSGKLHRASFRLCRFNAGSEGQVCASFDNREFTQPCSFDNATFIGDARFFDAQFHEDVSFRGASFKQALEPRAEAATFALGWRGKLTASKEARNRSHQQQEAAFRALRKRMAEVGSAKDERRFLALELRARRRRSDSEVSLIERALSACYDIVSDYGESILRPLIALALLVTCGSLIYYNCTPPQVTAAQAIEFSLQQIFKPFNVWSGDGAIIGNTPAELINATARTHAVRAGIWLKILASAQSIASLTLLFLAAQAIRRRFKLA